MWRTCGFAEVGGTLGVVASNGGYAGVSLEVDGERAGNCADLGCRHGARGWGVERLWCIPARGCGVNLVVKAGKCAIKLAGEGR